MAQLYRTFEAVSQKPGKVFHELVRCRRRELGLPVPPEERVLPFRVQPSVSLPALDLLIDQDSNEPDSSTLTSPTHTRILALLRTERRLEELDLAIGRMESTLRGPSRREGKEREKLIHAFEQETQVYETILHRRSEEGQGVEE